MPSIRIPFLIDIKRVDTKPDVRAVANDQTLDRDFKVQGPLVNRVLIARLNDALRFDGKPLSAVTPRGDAERARRQAALHARLDPAKASLWDDATLARLVAAVRGPSGDDIGPAAQQAVGRLFDANYVADAESFRAAQDLDNAARTPNPFQWLVLRLTGRLRRAKRLLREKVNGDLDGVHGTGVAVHNIVRGLVTMRELWRKQPRPLPDDAVRACLYAPRIVLREATVQAETAVGDVRPGTLVLVELDKLRAVSPDAESVFMADTWAECPAAAFVVMLLRAIWIAAIAAERAS
jgi:predicted nucleic acid-binding protein